MNLQNFPSLKEIGALLGSISPSKLMGMMDPLSRLLTALCDYRPAQGFEREIDLQSFLEQHRQLHAALSDTIDELIKLNLPLPQTDTEAPEPLDPDDIRQGLHDWLRDIDDAVAKLASTASAAPRFASEIAAEAQPITSATEDAGDSPLPRASVAEEVAFSAPPRESRDWNPSCKAPPEKRRAYGCVTSIRDCAGCDFAPEAVTP